jgi:cadmium resistance protein CadD (predicted permease)
MLEIIIWGVLTVAFGIGGELIYHFIAQYTRASDAWLFVSIGCWMVAFIFLCMFAERISNLFGASILSNGGAEHIGQSFQNGFIMGTILAH